ncbi:hypothetical protein GCM10020221_10860 [Streptomyces thioluteus]|uniref:AAA+ ATPase domain-containing protein n=1 Tax=Streptomyces thioluteus TaxID=66431 RepID=A0ABN3WJL4_STRTU
MVAEAVADGIPAARDAELADIDRSLRAGTGVLLVGEPGSGRSTLLRAASERARRAGFRVVRLEDAPDVPDTGRSVRGPGDRAVVTADDIHLADPAALAALHRPVRDGRLVVLATAPTGVPLPREVRRLVLDKELGRLEIRPFDRTAVARILAARFGGPVPVGTAERFWELSRGNALILRELMDCAPDDGGPPYEGGMPDGRLTELSELLLGDLTEDERDLVRMLALAGPLGAGLPVVTELGGAAEALDRRGVVTMERSGLRLSLRLTRPLCEAVVRGSLPELTARRLRIRVADAIEATGARRRGDVARLVALRMDTGRQPGPAEVRTAALDALRNHDFAFAERLCATVLSFEMSPAPDIALLLGRALAGQRRHQVAEALFAGVRRGEADPVCHADVVRARFLNLALGLHRVPEAEAVVAEAEYYGPPGGYPWCGELRLLTGLFTDRFDASAEPGDRRGVAPAALARHESGDAAGALALLREHPPGRFSWDKDSRLDHAVVTARVALHTEGPAAVAALLERLREEDGGPRHRLHTALLGADVHRWAGRTARGGPPPAGGRRTPRPGRLAHHGVLAAGPTGRRTGRVGGDGGGSRRAGRGEVRGGRRAAVPPGLGRRGAGVRRRHGPGRRPAGGGAPGAGRRGAGRGRGAGPAARGGTAPGRPGGRGRPRGGPRRAGPGAVRSGGRAAAARPGARER